MSGLLAALMLRERGWDADKPGERVESELSGRGAGIVAQPEPGSRRCGCSASTPVTSASRCARARSSTATAAWRAVSTVRRP